MAASFNVRDILGYQEDTPRISEARVTTDTPEPTHRKYSYRSERLKSLNDGKEKILTPQHRFSIKKAADKKPVVQQSLAVVEPKELKDTNEEAETKKSSVSGSILQNRGGERMSIPLLDRDASVSMVGDGSGSPSIIKKPQPTSGWSDDSDDDGEDGSQHLPDIMQKLEPTSSWSDDSRDAGEDEEEVEGKSEQEAEDEGQFEENKVNLVKSDFTFDEKSPGQQNRFSGISCPSPKTESATLKKTEAEAGEDTTPTQSPSPTQSPMQNLSPSSQPATSTKMSDAEDNTEIQIPTQKSLLDAIHLTIPDTSESEAEPTTKTVQSSEYEDIGEDSAIETDLELVIEEKEVPEDAPPVPAPELQTTKAQRVPQRVNTDASLETNKALVDLFAPLYEKRAKIVTYNETARVIRSLQDTPRGAVKVNSLGAGFRTSQSTTSLKRMIVAAGIEGEHSAPGMSPKTTGVKFTFIPQSEDDLQESSVGPLDKGKQRADAPPTPMQSTAGNEDVDELGPLVIETAESERRLSAELSQLLTRNDILRQELLQPVILPASTYAREYELMTSRWISDNQMSVSHAEKSWRQHVNDNISDSNEAVENAVDTWMFKRYGKSKYADSAAEDDIMVQMAKDELACAKARRDWYRVYRRQRRKERWRRFLNQIIDMILCRSKERDGPLVDVLRKLSDDQGGAGAAERATQMEKHAKGSPIGIGSRKSSRSRRGSENVNNINTIFV